MKFLADIPFSRSIVSLLASHGHECLLVRDELQPTAMDEAIVRLAIDRAACILCFDLDFTTIVASSREPWPSVITFRMSTDHPAKIHARLVELLPEIVQAATTGSLITVEDDRLRVRPLPVKA